MAGCGLPSWAARSRRWPLGKRVPPGRPELEMTVARSVGDVLDDHVTLEVECVDRMYLNLYVPKLVYPTGVVGFFKYHRGMPVVSGALMDPISKDFVANIH